MSTPLTPADAIRAAAERLVAQRESAHAQAEQLAETRQQVTQEASGEVPSIPQG